MVAIQGAVSEHIACINRILKEDNLLGKSLIVRKPKDIDACDGVIIPGGESTTISRFLVKNGLFDALHKRIARQDIALMGTCAGCVMLAKELTDTTSEIHLLEAMDMKVERNAFGRQKDSFEHTITIKGMKTPFHAVFIRAPRITNTWGDCEVYATIQKEIIMARQDNYLALSFHPELTADLRVHRFFIEML